jgi:ornithine cyclodeaminase
VFGFNPTVNSTDLSPEQTAAALPYRRLSACLRDLLLDPTVVVPARIVHPLHGGGSLFVMPASDAQWAMTKLITFVADNPARGLPAIQGDVAVFDLSDGQRKAMLHGPTVTARRTAAVSLLATQVLAPQLNGPLLIVGAGVQGRSHLEAFATGLGVKQVQVASRSVRSADALVDHARGLGLQAQRVDDLKTALAECPLVVTCTSAQEVAVHHMPRPDAMVCAVGAFTPQMVEWEASVVRRMAQTAKMVVDTREADHEAGDLLQAGLAVQGMATLGDVIRGDAPSPSAGPVFFKSCGWAGWDLAAVRCWAQGAASNLIR